MERKVSLNFIFNKSNEEIKEFTRFLFEDIKKCLVRFKAEVIQNEKSNPKDRPFRIICLSSKDLTDQSFLAEIKSLSESPDVVLLNLDPIKSGDPTVPLYKFRIFKLWDEIKETSELRFYRRDNPQTMALYWEVLTDICVEIDEKYSETSLNKREKIYLAQTDDSQTADRDNLIRDLTELGYDVVPNKLLSNDYDLCIKQINELLKDCKLIIHPIPLVYSKYFNEKEISVVDLQAQVSAKNILPEKHNVKRIIWIPSDFEITDEENQIFVEKIQRDQDQSQNTLVLKITLEELKKIYRKVLSGENLDQKDTLLPDVYLIADDDDEKTGKKLIQENAQKGVVITRNFRGITYHQHLNYLAKSETVIINYTNENVPWFTMKVNDIFKSKGINQSRPFKKLILIKDKKDLNTVEFENRFSEVLVSSLDDLKIDLPVKNN
jgi:hypothetical protein